jgi:hypothetical protein
MSVRHIHWSPAPCPGCAEEDTLERIAEAVRAERETWQPVVDALASIKKTLDHPPGVDFAEVCRRNVKAWKAAHDALAAIRARGQG